MIPRLLPRTLAAALAAGLALAAASAAGAGGPVIKRAKYKGTTTPGSEAVTFQVSRDGKHVLNFTTRLGYDGLCGQGGGPTYTVKAASLKLRPNGTFKGSATGTSGPASVVIRVSGRLNGRKAGGVVEEPTALHCIFGPNRGANAYSETFTAAAT